MLKHFETLDEAGEAFKKGEINVTELREFFKEFIETTKDNVVEDDPTGILRDLLANKKEFDIDRVLVLMQNNGYPTMSKQELCQTISNLASEAYDKMIGTTKDDRKSCGTSSRYGITITCFPEVDAVGYKVEYVYAETYLNGITKKDIKRDIDKAEYLANRKLYKNGARLIDGGYSVEGVTVDNVQHYLDEDHSPESLFPGFIYDWTNVKGVCYTLVCIEGKFNFLTTDGKILSDDWFENVIDNKNGYPCVKVNGKYTWYDIAKNKLSDDRYNFVTILTEMCDGNHYGVGFKDTHNILLCYETGKVVEKVSNKNNNYNKMVSFCFLDNKTYAVRNEFKRWCVKSLLTKEPICGQTFDLVHPFKDGFALVNDGGPERWNFINEEGNLLSEKWFEKANHFHNDHALVILGGKKYNLSKTGKLTKVSNGCWCFDEEGRKKQARDIFYENARDAVDVVSRWLLDEKAERPFDSDNCLVESKQNEEQTENQETELNIITEGFVDLGLPSGTLWAAYNYGCNSPEEYGKLYNWDEAKKLDCTLPSEEQIKELKEHTTYKWGTFNGKAGGVFTGENNNSIFLPAADLCGGMSLTNVGGYYWSSSLSDDNPNYAYNLYFHSDYVRWSNYYRFCGMAVRPICNK